jgi:hypothetical protein
MMKSLFSQLFLALQAHIKANVPSIRWIDQDLGQLESYEIRPAVSWPCVLIDFNHTSFEQMQQNRQLGNITFTLRLGFDSYSQSASIAPQEVREKALEYYELEQELYEAVQGFDGGGLMQDCTRINIATERRDGDNFRVRVLTFSSMTEDSSAMSKTTKAARPSLELEPEIRNEDSVNYATIEGSFSVD